MLNQPCIPGINPVFNQTIEQEEIFFFFFKRDLQCGLFSTYHPVLQKNKSKAWPVTPTTCGGHMSMEPIYAMGEIPNPHVYTQHTLYTHLCKPGKLRTLKANKAI